jgi:hypothetical protein
MDIVQSLTNSLQEIEAMPNGRYKAALLAVNGLMTDGGHHKQWYLERILEALDVNLSDIRESLNAMGYDFDGGTAP